MSKKRQSGPFDRAVVALANHYQFAAKTSARSRCVQSRMLLWCKTGTGEMRVNRRRLRLGSGDFMLLPWGHDITYRADSSDPFFVGGIHIIPVHARTKPMEFVVPHNAGHELFDCSYRQDSPAAALPGWLVGSFDDHRALEHLAEYIVAWYQRGRLDEPPARRLGQSLLEELAHIHRTPTPERAKHPIRLMQMVEYAQNHLGERLSIDQLAAIGHCSTSTVHRLFRQAFGVAPMDWIIDWRMRQAARRLSTTSLSVGTVGREVGIDDPYYFSKLFRIRMGVTASEYRKRNTLT